VAFHQLPGKSAHIYIDWPQVSPPKKVPEPKVLSYFNSPQSCSFHAQLEFLSPDVTRLFRMKCLAHQKYQLGDFKEHWTLNQHEPSVLCFTFVLFVPDLIFLYIFGGPQDIFAMIQLPVFVFHIGSTERSDIISKWCPKTASTTSQSPRFWMLRDVTESTENTLETTIFHPNNSRQQISQRLETYLRKHNPLTNHSSDYDDSIDSIGYDTTCAAKRPAWICKSSQICLAQSKMPLAAARSMIRPFSASWHPKSKRRKDSEINGSTGRWWMCSKNV